MKIQLKPEKLYKNGNVMNGRNDVKIIFNFFEDNGGKLTKQFFRLLLYFGLLNANF